MISATYSNLGLGLECRCRCRTHCHWEIYEVNRINNSGGVTNKYIINYIRMLMVGIMKKISTYKKDHLEISDAMPVVRIWELTTDNHICISIPWSLEVNIFISNSTFSTVAWIVASLINDTTWSEKKYFIDFKWLNEDKDGLVHHNASIELLWSQQDQESNSIKLQYF